jgi:MoaA/NifB/PqqE/SkfB family radical SAM enzyme
MSTTRSLLPRREERFDWGRLAWRLGRRKGPQVLTEAPVRPVGAKLEITYACNLRCGFCYTDSPRRTRQRTPELSDEQWDDVVTQALDLGIVEAVVTGGEPLLRKELTLGLIERLAGNDVGVAFNNNGWFVDDEVASRLGALRGVTAHVSIDGARPGLHDVSRGVPGSWRRAIEGVDRLLAAGVGVCIVHVVTPANAGAVPEFLEQMWSLGVPWVRMTPVVQTGAAARGGDWDISREGLRDAAREFEERRGTAMRIQVVPGTGGGLSLQGREAPGSFLVRPNGDIRPDSLRPFTFGNAIEDSVETCWERIRDGWDDERINKWANGMKKPQDLRASSLVAYLDDEIDLVGDNSERGSGRDAPLPEPTPPPEVEPAEDLGAAKLKVQELALGRRYRNAPLRWSGGPGYRFLRLARSGAYLRVNESGAVVMDSLDGGTLGDAVGALGERYGLGEERATEDAMAALRELQRQGVVIAGSGSGEIPVEVGTSDLPGSEPNG